VAKTTAELIADAKALELFMPHGAFEVHCVHCHARLDGNGDCATCGLIGRPATELERRAASDPDRVNKLLEGAIAKRRAYTPATRA
jgi:hypothetical protein